MPVNGGVPLCTDCTFIHICLLTLHTRMKTEVILIQVMRVAFSGTSQTRNRDSRCAMLTYIQGRAITKVVSHPPFTTEAGRFKQDFWWTNWHWGKFFSEFLSFSMSTSFHHSPPYSYIAWGMSNRPVVAAVQRRRLNPSTWTTYSANCCHGWKLFSPMFKPYAHAKKAVLSHHH
jgi:hypothetical protein